jgi:hypothetical protein
LACLAHAGGAEQATTSYQATVGGVKVTIEAQGGSYVMVPFAAGTGVQVFPCDTYSPEGCWPDKLQKYQQATTNVTLDSSDGYGNLKLIFGKAPWLSFNLKLELDKKLKQKWLKVERDGVDLLQQVEDEGGFGVDATSDKTVTVELQVFSLKQNAYSECAWDGDDCFRGKCCKTEGMVCYLKDDFFGMCMANGTCQKGHKDDGDGKNWSCTEAGAFPRLDPLPQAEDDGKVAGTSLFCFTMATPLTYETSLVAAQKKAGVGIFACDKSKVYEGATTDKKTKAVVIKAWTDIWKEVRDDGMWKAVDWSVKVEPDCVFMPQRLQWHLGGIKPYADTPLFMKSSLQTGLPTPLMVISKDALELLFADKEKCEEKVEKRKGESFYIATCLLISGSNYILDQGLIDDKLSEVEGGWDLTDASACSDSDVVAHHAFQQAEHWLDCYNNAMDTTVTK